MQSWEALTKYQKHKDLNEKQKKVFSHIQKFKSSFKNKYCLYCRTEILEENHFCKQLENVGDQIVLFYFEFLDETKKEIINELKNELLIDQELSQTIRNKILAYSL